MTLTPDLWAALTAAQKLAHEMRDGGATLKAIAERLEADGYPTRSGAPWTLKYVHRFLKSPPPAKPSARYGARHARTVAARGDAAGYRCTECGKQAFAWATLHGTDGMRPEDYQPMCQPCHLAYDGITGNERSAEHRANISAYASNRTPEHQARLNESLSGRAGGMTGKRHSEETRRKMRESQRARFPGPQEPEAAPGA